jgi:uncharacterized protein YndB with AHSA1/START domain
VNQPAADILWPAEFDLSTHPVHVHNELAMTVPRERVWAWLIRATIWPVWYPNSNNVRIVEGAPTDLAYGTRFRWRTFSTAIESQVKEFEPYERIAWDARGFGVYAYHAWLLRETPGGGCHVVTEERQHGWAAKGQAVFLPHRMSNGHQMWLENLHKCAGVR